MQQGGNKSRKKCNKGLRCTRADCRFKHPEGWDPHKRAPSHPQALGAGPSTHALEPGPSTQALGAGPCTHAQSTHPALCASLSPAAPPPSPARPPSTFKKACFRGMKCSRPDCRFQHPQGWDPLKSSQAAIGRPQQQQQQQQQASRASASASIPIVAANQGKLDRDVPPRQAGWQGNSTSRTPEPTRLQGMAGVEAAMQGIHLGAGTRLTALPPDCLALIFKFCQGVETKRSFFSTCKALRCNAVAAQIEVLTLSCKPKDILLSAAAMERFERWCPNLSTLRLKATPTFMYADSDDELSYSSLEEDSLEDECSSSGSDFVSTEELLQLLKTARKSPPAAALLSRITRLHLVDFEEFHSLHVKPLVTNLKAACPQLSSLSLEDVDLSTGGLSALKPLQLKELAIESFDDNESEPLFKLDPLVQMTTLQALKLDCDAQMDKLGVLGRMQQLKKLDIQSVSSEFGDTMGLEDALEGLRNLEVLELNTLPADEFTPPPSLKSLIIGYLNTASLFGLADLQEHKIPCIKIRSLIFDHGIWPTRCDEVDEHRMECARTVAAMPEVDWQECQELCFDLAAVRLTRPKGAGSGYAPEPPSSMDDGVVEYMGHPLSTFWALESVLTVLALFADSGLARSVRSLVFREADVSIKSMRQLAIFTRVSSLTFKRCIMSRESLVEAVRRWRCLDTVDVSGLCVLDVEMVGSVNSSPTSAVVAGMQEKAKADGGGAGGGGAAAAAAPPQPLSIILQRTWGKEEVSYERSFGEQKIAEVVAAWKRLPTSGQRSLVHVEVVDGMRKRPAPLMLEAAENWDHLWSSGDCDLMEVESEMSERDDWWKSEISERDH